MTSLPRNTNKGRWKGLFQDQEKFQQSIHSRQFQQISFKSNKECSCFLESFQLTVFALEAVWITIVNPRQSGLSSIHPIKKFIYQKINILYKCHLKKPRYFFCKICACRWIQILHKKQRVCIWHYLSMFIVDDGNPLPISAYHFYSSNSKFNWQQVKLYFTETTIGKWVHSTRMRDILIIDLQMLFKIFKKDKAELDFN